MNTTPNLMNHHEYTETLVGHPVDTPSNVTHTTEQYHHCLELAATYLDRERLNFELRQERTIQENSHVQRKKDRTTPSFVHNLHYLDLTVAVHNIRGMGSNTSSHKLDDLMLFLKDYNTDVVIITETNTDDSLKHFIDNARYNDQFEFIFSYKDRDKNRNKGYGVAIALKTKWARHIYKIDRISPYLIRIALLFEQREINIIAIYAAPESKRDIHNTLIDSIKTLQRHSRCGLTHTLNLIAGDFNEIVNLDLDKKSPGSKSTNGNTIQRNVLHQLQSLGFKDTFRLINNNKRAYTYKHSNGATEEPTYTRIDMLWMQGPENVMVTKAIIVPLEGCTNSDHEILITRIYMAEFIVNNRRCTRRITFDQLRDRISHQSSEEGNNEPQSPEVTEDNNPDIISRRVIDLDKTPKEKIETFQRACKEFVNKSGLLQRLSALLLDSATQNDLNNVTGVGDNLDYTNQHQTIRLEDINNIWSQVTIGIDKAIDDNLHTRNCNMHKTKQISKKPPEYIATKHTSKLYKLTKELKKFHDKSANRTSHEEIPFDMEEKMNHWAIISPKYDQDYKDPQLTQFTDKGEYRLNNIDIRNPSCVNDLEEIVKVRRKMDRSIKKFLQSKRIVEAIEKRHDIIQSDQSRWITSIQGKFKERLVIDRVVVQDHQGNSSLELNPNQIKKEVEKHIRHTFRKRDCKLDNMDEEWKRVYEPIGEYREEWYRAIEPVTLEEWMNTLSKLNMGSAAGPSGIDYRVIRLFPDELHQVIIAFVNLTIRVGMVPDYWKQSYLCPFPKPNRFEYDLNNIRPIMLLDTIRKSATKLVMERVSAILSRNHMLKGHNFCGLKNEDTSTPLTILNSIIEDAKEQGKELHVVTQDIKKAYDSVSIASLRLSLTRLRMPISLVDWICNLYEERSIRAITAFGLTDSVTARDGIDQGDALSPLMWRIFYDPLLVRLQDRVNSGYNMKIDWPSDIRHNDKYSLEFNLPAMAYMDDTIYLDHTVDGIQASIDIAGDFYRIHDIEVNGPKTDYIAINAAAGKERNKVTIGKDRVEHTPTNKAIQYLGCFFASQRSANKVKIIIKNIVDEFISPLKGKCISAGQIEYLVDRILVPRCVYVGQLTNFSEHEWDSLFSPVLKLVKHKCGFASSMPTSALLHQNIINISTPWNRLVALQMTNLVNNLNTSTLVHTAVRIRLQTAQLRLGIPRCILTYDVNYLKTHLGSGLHNNSLTSMIRGRMMGIEIRQSSTDQRDWDIKGGSHAICAFLYEHDASGLILRCNNHRGNYPLIYFEQIIIGDGKAISWALYKQLQGASTRGKVATWFKKLNRFVENGCAPLANATRKDLKLWRYIEAYLAPAAPGSYIGKKDILLVLPKNIEEAPIIGQARKGRKVHNDDCIDIRRVALKAVDSVSTGKMFKTIKAICHDWVGICNYEAEDSYREEVAVEDESIIVQPDIVLTGYDVWIDKWLDDRELQDTLMNIKQAIQEGWKDDAVNRKLDIYTDGSLTTSQYRNTISHYKSDNYYVSMGAGVYIKDQQNREYKIATKVRNWPSSTRSEIIAILLALMAVPEEADVVIYTDSKCALDDILTWNTKSARAKEKTTNHCILFRINQIRIEKRINIEFVKVKGHSNVRGNDEADRLAVEGSSSNSQFNFNIEHTSQEYRYIPTFEHIPIEPSLKKFIIQFLNTYNAMEWSLLQSNREHCHMNVRQIAWEITWGLLNQFRGFRCRSSREHHMFVFMVKLLHRCLPLGNVLLQRKRDIYSHYRCQNCSGNCVEDWDHLFECPGYDEAWKHIYDTLKKQYRMIRLKELKLDITDTPKLQRAVDDLLSNSVTSAQFRDFRRLSTQIKCDRTWIASLKKTLRINETEVTGLYVHFLFRFIILFREMIWKPRCELTNRWEKSHAITKQTKYQKCTTRRRSSCRKRLRTQNTHEHTTPSFIQQSGYRPQPLASRAPTEERLQFDDDSIECYDNPFIPPLVPPPLFTRNDRLREAVPITFRAMKNYLANYILEPWVAVGKKLRLSQVYRMVDL
ncbi:hypothetical protein RclHR1_04620010 [Rhizophagus clarus]|nr:hypothetical protein RclHR1_04620010 [Rhizophagus clarus]